MCLSNAKQIQLKEDLTVYKFARVHDNCIIFPLFGHGVYNFHVVEYATCEEHGGPEIQSLCGLNVKYTNNNDELEIYDGMFHSFDNIRDCNIYMDDDDRQCIGAKLIECVIPKDSIVFEGEFEFFGYHGKESFKSYASNKIIYKRIIK